MHGRLFSASNVKFHTCIFASDESIPRRAQTRSMKTGVERQRITEISDVSPEAVPRRMIVHLKKTEKVFFCVVRKRNIPGSIAAAGDCNFQ